MKAGDYLIMSSKELKRKAVLEKVIEKTLSLADAAQKMEVSYRQAKRIIRKYRQAGDRGLIHANRGKPSSRAYAAEFKNKVIKIYQEKYFDFGPTLAAEKMQEDDAIIINPETLRLWLLWANLWCHKRHRKKYYQRRERKQRFGELLQIDGSIHHWFGNNHPSCCLLNIVDDATGITMSQLDTGETCYVLLSTLKLWIEKYGIPKAVYVDLKSLYVSPQRLTNPDVEITANVFERVCHSLNIEIIKAYSPQAKGRVERNHGVYQDRFVKELRLRNITTIEEANVFLKIVYLDKINNKFARQPAIAENAHYPIQAYGDLDQIFCWEYRRQIGNDFTVRFNSEFFQLGRQSAMRLLPRQSVIIHIHLNGSISIWHNNLKLDYKKLEAMQIPKKTVYQCKGYDSMRRSRDARANKHKTPWSQFDPTWLRHKKTLGVSQLPNSLNR